MENIVSKAFIYSCCETCYCDYSEAPKKVVNIIEAWTGFIFVVQQILDA